MMLQRRSTDQRKIHKKKLQRQYNQNIKVTVKQEHGSAPLKAVVTQPVKVVLKPWVCNSLSTFVLQKWVIRRVISGDFVNGIEFCDMNAPIVTVHNVPVNEEPMFTDN